MKIWLNPDPTVYTINVDDVRESLCNSIYCNFRPVRMRWRG